MLHCHVCMTWNAAKTCCWRLKFLLFGEAELQLMSSDCKMNMLL